MKHFAQTNVERLLSTGNIPIPFVGTNIPPIRLDKTVKLPFIRNKQPFVLLRGFTLVELLVTMIIVGILVAYAMPSMNNMVRNSDLITQNNNLISDVNLARSEAIKNARTARICTWNSTATPNNPACDNNGDWSLGRVIWVDRNNNGAIDIGEIVRSRPAISPLTLNQIQAGGKVEPITINSRGQSTSAFTVIFALCDARGAALGKDLRLSSMGQFAMFPGPPASCN